MAGKKIWVTWLPGKEQEADLQATLQSLQMVGLEVSGAPWADDLEKCAWTEVTDMLTAENGPELWLISGRQIDFDNARYRYGLSMLAMSLSVTHPNLRVFVQCIDGVMSQPMPLLCQHWTVLDSAPGWNAKVVAAAYGGAVPTPDFDFHLTVIAHSAIGQWIEIGPRKGGDAWAGIMAGIVEDEDAKIMFQGVGPRGQLPEKSVNEFPMQGIKAEISGDDYEAWALKNTISDAESYYLKVQGFPEKLMFGSHPENDDVEAHIIDLM